MKETESKACVICKKDYSPKRTNQVTCGSKECVKYRNNHSHRRTIYSRIYTVSGVLAEHGIKMKS